MYKLHSDFVRKYSPESETGDGKLTLSGEELRGLMEFNYPDIVDVSLSPYYLEKKGLIFQLDKNNNGLEVFKQDYERQISVEINGTKPKKNHEKIPDEFIVADSCSETVKNYLKDNGASDTALDKINSCYYQNVSLPFWKQLQVSYMNSTDALMIQSPERESSVIINEDSVSFEIKIQKFTLSLMKDMDMDTDIQYQIPLSIELSCSFEKDGFHIERVKFGNRFSKDFFTGKLLGPTAHQKLIAHADSYKNTITGKTHDLQEGSELANEEHPISRIITALIKLGLNTSAAKRKVKAAFPEFTTSIGDIAETPITEGAKAEEKTVEVLTPLLREIIAAKEKVEEKLKTYKQANDLDVLLLRNLKHSITVLIEKIDAILKLMDGATTEFCKHLKNYKEQCNAWLQEFNDIAAEIVSNEALLKQVKENDQEQALATLTTYSDSVIYGLQDETKAEKSLLLDQVAREDKKNTDAQLWKLTGKEKSHLFIAYPNSLRVQFQKFSESSGSLADFSYPVNDQADRPNHAAKFFGNELLKGLNGEDYVFAKENNLKAALSIKDLVVLRDQFQQADNAIGFVESSIFYQKVATMDLATLRATYKSDIKLRNLLALRPGITERLAYTNSNVFTLLSENKQAFAQSQLTRERLQSVKPTQSTAFDLQQQNFSKLATSGTPIREILAETDTQGFIALVTAFSKKGTGPLWLNQGAGTLQTAQNEKQLLDSISQATQLASDNEVLAGSSVVNIAGMLSCNKEARAAAFTFAERALITKAHPEMSQEIFNSLVSLAIFDETAELAQKLVQTMNSYGHLAEYGDTPEGQSTLLKLKQQHPEACQTLNLQLPEPTQNTVKSFASILTDRALLEQVAKSHPFSIEELRVFLEGEHSQQLQLNYPLPTEQKNELIHALIHTDELKGVKFLPNTPFAEAANLAKMMKKAIKPVSSSHAAIVMETPTPASAPKTLTIDELVGTLMDSDKTIQEFLTDLKDRWKELLSNERFQDAILDIKSKLHTRALPVIQEFIKRQQSPDEKVQTAVDYPFIVALAKPEELHALFSAPDISTQVLVDWIIYMPDDTRQEFMTDALREKIASEKAPLDRLELMFDRVNDTELFLGSNPNVATALATKLPNDGTNQDLNKKLDDYFSKHVTAGKMPLDRPIPEVPEAHARIPGAA